MAALPVLNPSPKQKFLADERSCKSHFELVSRDDLRRSLEVALAQYQWKLAATGDGEPAMRHYLSCGAHDFLDVFFNLALPPQVREVKPVGQLNYK